MSGSVRKARLNVREALSDIREWSGVSLGCPRVVRNPSRLSGRPLGCPGVVGRPYSKVQEALPNVRELSGDLPKCPGVVRNLF